MLTPTSLACFESPEGVPAPIGEKKRNGNGSQPRAFGAIRNRDQMSSDKLSYSVGLQPADKQSEPNPRATDSLTHEALIDESRPEDKA
jgi:hypothetical protein